MDLDRFWELIEAAAAAAGDCEAHAERLTATLDLPRCGASGVPVLPPYRGCDAATLPAGPWPATAGRCADSMARVLTRHRRQLRAAGAGGGRLLRAALHQRMAEAYRWDPYGLAYQLNGGGSDDGFVYLRCCLLPQGRATWEAASPIRTR